MKEQEIHLDHGAKPELKDVESRESAVADENESGPYIDLSGVKSFMWSPMEPLIAVRRDGKPISDMSESRQ